MKLVHNNNAQTFENHLTNLMKLSGVQTREQAIKLYKQLIRLERKANWLATMECNGTAPFQQSYTDDEDDAEQLFIPIIDKVKKLLPNAKTFFINHDARGYALKLKESEARELGIYQDWGGYGIIAPDLSRNPFARS